MRAALLEFSDVLAQASAPLESVPDRFLPLIGLLGEENDRSIADVARAVHASIVTSLLASDPDLEQSTAEARLPLATVLAALEAAGERVNYGLSAADVCAHAAEPLAHAAAHAAVGVPVYRFEIQPPVWHALSEELRNRLATRRAERREAQAQCGAFFASLPEEEQGLLVFGNKKKAAAALAHARVQVRTQTQAQTQTQIQEQDRDQDQYQMQAQGPVQTLAKTQTQTSSDSAGAIDALQSGTANVAGEPVPTASAPVSTEQRSPSRPASSTPKLLPPSPERKSRSPSPKFSEGKERVKAERAEQRAAKDRVRQAKLAERERLQANQLRQANFLAGFLGRSKKATAVTAQQQTPEKLSKVSPEKSSPADEDAPDAFTRTFLPCVIKNLAPCNRFAGNAAGTADDVASLINSEPAASPAHLLAEWGEAMPLSVRARALDGRDPDGRVASGVQSSVSVREVMHLVRESDVLGEGAAEAARAGLTKLRDVQMKYVLFHTDLRPGWVGTWTRSSAVVGPRTPYGQDLVQLDYALDSDAEWEAPEEGDGEEIADEDEDDAESDNSDYDDSDWLEDDMGEAGDGDGVHDVDDAVSDMEQERDSPSPTKPVSNRPKSSAGAGAGVGVWGRALTSKRSAGAWGGKWAAAMAAKQRKKHKAPMVKKLIPYASSVHWETELGSCDPAFQSFQLTFFPSFSLGMDPFAALARLNPVPGAGTGAGMGADAGEDPEDALVSGGRKKTCFPEDLTGQFVAALYTASSRSNRGSLSDELYTLFACQSKVSGAGPGTTPLTRAAVDRKLDEVAVKRGKVYVARPEFEHLVPASAAGAPAESG